MNPIQPQTNRTHIVVVCLSIFALLVVVGLSGACAGRPDSSGATSSPSPTPTPTGSPRALDGDTPIIVKGGGSIDLDFNTDVFTGTTPSCTNCRITRVDLEQIKDKGEPIPQTPVLTQCTFTGPPTIRILTKGGTDNVTVNSITGGVVIDFDAAKYPGIITECGDAKKHHSKDGEIENVTVNGTSCGGCSKWKRCKVSIHVF